MTTHFKVLWNFLNAPYNPGLFLGFSKNHCYFMDLYDPFRDLNIGKKWEIKIDDTKSDIMPIVYTPMHIFS